MVIYRHLETPDKTIVISRHLHDYCSYKDKNGKTYVLDGGPSGGYFERYNRYAKEYVKLKDISDKWLQSIIDWFIDESLETNPIFRLFIEEKLLRSELEIFVPESEHLMLEYD